MVAVNGNYVILISGYVSMVNGPPLRAHKIFDAGFIEVSRFAVRTHPHPITHYAGSLVAGTWWHVVQMSPSPFMLIVSTAQTKAHQYHCNATYLHVLFDDISLMFALPKYGDMFFLLGIQIELLSLN